MPNLNHVILIGRLSRDPEQKHLPSRSAVCNLSLAVNRTWTTDLGERKEEVTFVDVTAFGKPGEVIAQYLRKGDPILVEGRLRTENWEKDGQKRSKLSVVLESFQFMGEKRADDNPRPEQPARARGTPPPNSPPGNGKVPVDDSDDTPF